MLDGLEHAETVAAIRKGIDPFERGGAVVEGSYDIVAAGAPKTNRRSCRYHL
jgi:hypothetical protein